MSQDGILNILSVLAGLLVWCGLMLLTKKTIKKVDQRSIDTFKMRTYSLEDEQEALKLLLDKKNKDA